MKHNNDSSHEEHSKDHYHHLLMMGLLHLPIMYTVMFAMVDSTSSIFNNLNMLYMAGMMVAPMFFIMPLTMRKMYQDPKLNLIVYVGSIALFLICFLFIRQQTLIDDRQFLRSMIPHHSGAILMCEKAHFQDTEIKALCDNIVKSQSEEIDQMKKVLERL